MGELRKDAHSLMWLIYLRPCNQIGSRNLCSPVKEVNSYCSHDRNDLILGLNPVFSDIGMVTFGDVRSRMRWLAN